MWMDRSWWWTGRPGVLRFMGSQRVGHDWATDLIWKMWFIHTMKYYLAIKKNEIMPFTATWMQLEIILSMSARERQVPCGVTYVWNLKYGTNELIYKTEIDSVIEIKLAVARKVWGGRRVDWEFGIGQCKLLHLEWINGKVLSYIAQETIFSLPG